MDTTTLFAAITGGELDADLDRIVLAVRDRQMQSRQIDSLLGRSSATSRQARATAHLGALNLQPGDQVRLNEQTRPAYMRGVVATVNWVNDLSVSVRIAQTTGRFRAGEKIRVPATFLEKI